LVRSSGSSPGCCLQAEHLSRVQSSPSPGEYDDYSEEYWHTENCEYIRTRDVMQQSNAAFKLVYEIL
jgi:hypothetical protein